MDKLRVLSIIILLCILTGCNQTPLNTDSEFDDTGINKEEASYSPPAGNMEGTDPTPFQTPDGHAVTVVESTASLQPSSPSPESSEIPTRQPESETDVAIEPPPAETILDYNVLDALDSAKRSWISRINFSKKNKSDAPSTQKMLDTYDCLYIGDITQKYVYLTIDEGYELGYTSKILDVLKDNDVQTLFFITGRYMDRNKKLVQRMLDEGHEVGNHTYNHPSLPELDNQTLEEELLGFEQKFYLEFGKRFKYMRPPMGEISEKSLAAAQQLGYKTVLWSFAYRDYDTNDQKGPDYAYQQVIEGLHSGAIILLHAVSSDNAEALDSIIKGIRAEGYEIRPFDL